MWWTWILWWTMMIRVSCVSNAHNKQSVCREWSGARIEKKNATEVPRASRLSTKNSPKSKCLHTFYTHTHHTHTRHYSILFYMVKNSQCLHCYKLYVLELKYFHLFVEPLFRCTTRNLAVPPTNQQWPNKWLVKIYSQMLKKYLYTRVNAHQIFAYIFKMRVVTQITKRREEKILRWQWSICEKKGKKIPTEINLTTVET